MVTKTIGHVHTMYHIAPYYFELLVYVNTCTSFFLLDRFGDWIVPIQIRILDFSATEKPLHSCAIVCGCLTW